MIAFGVFVAVIFLLWAATMWALYIEFRAQRYRDRAKPESCRGPVADHDYMAFWQGGARDQPLSGRGYVRASNLDPERPLQGSSIP